MKLITTMTVLMLALPAAAQAPALESAAGNVKGLVQSLRRETKSDKTDFRAAAVTGIWTDQDCQKVTFAPEGPNTSKPIELESRTWIEECNNIPMPYPPGGSQCIPGPRRLLTWDNATVVVEFAERGAPAAEEVVQVCLWGKQLSGKVKKSPFKYDMVMANGRLTLRVRK